MAAGQLTYRAIATDYDGTLAFEGEVDEPTIEALRRARDAGIRLVMVTGRELPSLFNIFPHTALFDRIVGENGALVYDPSTTDIELLAPAPPPALVDALQRAEIPLSVGHSIVATWRPHEIELSRLIAEHQLEWDIIFNKDAVMALPRHVTKATGLEVALKALEIVPEDVIGIGDAENDHAFLRMCGLAVAVDNALPALKEIAQVVTAGARGDGVREAIDALLSGTIAPNQHTV